MEEEKKDREENKDNQNDDDKKNASSSGEGNSDDDEEYTEEEGSGSLEKKEDEKPEDSGTAEGSDKSEESELLPDNDYDYYGDDWEYDHGMREDEIKPSGAVDSGEKSEESEETEKTEESENETSLVKKETESVEKKEETKEKKKKKHKEKRMSFIEHLEELRWVLFKCIGSIIVFTITSYIFSKQFVDFLTAPYFKSVGDSLIALGPADVFLLRINLSIVIGIIISFPVILYQFWKFIAPGLLKREKKFFPWIIFFTILCFLIGASFAYYMIIPLGLSFFSQFETERLIMNVSVDKYVKFVTRLLIAFGVSFELPIMSLLLAKMGLLSPDLMKSIRGYAIVIIFAGAAVLTPPDITSQVFLALPLLVLYEISIWIVKIFSKRAERELEDDYEEEDKEEEEIDNDYDMD